jgi:hypothetical protein
MVHEALPHLWLYYKRMAENLARVVQTGGSVEVARAIHRGSAERADGGCICSACGLEYIQHPQLLEMPTFHLLCDGKVVKL